MSSSISISRTKELWELIKAGATLDAQERIMELRQAMLDLQEENLALKEELREANQQLAVPALVIDRGVYWVQLEGDSRDGPFCPLCADGAGKRIRLREAGTFSTPHQWGCDMCSSLYPA